MNIRRFSEGSAYYGFYEKKGVSFSDDFSEEPEANPDVLPAPDEESSLPDGDIENLGAYYKAVDHGCLEKLTPTERKIWKLVFFRGGTEKGTAKKLGLSRSTVRTHLKNAGAKIKREIVAERRKKWLVKDTQRKDSSQG